MTKKYTPHVFATSVLFTLGNAIIILPDLNFLTLAFSCVLSLVIIFLTGLVFEWGQKSKPVFLCVSLVAIASALAGAVGGVWDYARYLKSEQMPQTSIMLSAALFVAIILFIATRKRSAVYKYCLLIIVILAFVMAVCFVGGIKFFNYENLKLSENKTSFSPKNYSHFFAPIIALTVFVKNEHPKISPVAIGVSTGFILLGVAVLQTVLTIGVKADIPYLYLKSVGVISSGSLFTRLDGLVWFLFFATAIVRTTVCIKMMIEVWKKAKQICCDGYLQIKNAVI